MMKRILSATLILAMLLSLVIQSATATDMSAYVTNVETNAEGRVITTYDLSLVPEGTILPNRTDDEETEVVSYDLATGEVIKTETAKTAPHRMFTTTVGGISLNLSLVYDNAYQERILIPGKQVTVLLDAANLSGEEKTINTIIALYDDNSRLVATQFDTNIIASGASDVFSSSIIAPINKEVTSAKIMLWNQLEVMQPYGDVVVLTLDSEDYFGDDYSLSQPLDAYLDAIGAINFTNDIDVFSFTALKDGLYTFESYGNTDVTASLRNASNTQIAADDNGGDGNNFRLSYTLVAGQKYYLYINGHETGDYAIRAFYAIGNIYGTISPVKCIDYEPEFNAAIEGKVTLTTYDTNEFVAAMHLKEWSTSTSEYASFDMTGIHGGTYLVSFTRPGYLTRYRKIVLNDNRTDLGSVVLLAGDVDGNGIINAADSTLLQSLYGKEYGQSGYNVTADLNGDKIINAADLALLTPNLNKNANIYGENVNVITANTNLSGSALTISGTAAASSTVTVNVYQGSTGIFNESVSANGNGAYSTTCNLSKAGTYTIVVTAGNRAIDAIASVIY